MRPLLRSEETREWLRLAARDLRVAELALGDSDPLINEALFHAQQAAEKALKAYLVWHEVRYPLTHDIRRLLDLCAKIDATLDDELSPAVALTQFAVRFRYPGEDQPTLDEARAWLALGRETVDRVCVKIQL